MLELATRRLLDIDPAAAGGQYRTLVLERLAGSVPEPLTMFAALLPRQVEVLDDQHEETMSIRNSIGVIQGDLGDTDRASELLTTVIDFQRYELGKDHPSPIQTMNNPAGIYRPENRNEDGIKLMQEVLDIELRVLSDDRPRTVVSLDNLGSLFQRIHRHAEAAEVLRAAPERRRRTHRVVQADQ
ncbi:MAG: tetratricopeptide repeat protein [Planctomycetota bacterium]